MVVWIVKTATTAITTTVFSDDKDVWSEGFNGCASSDLHTPMKMIGPEIYHSGGGGAGGVDIIVTTSAWLTPRHRLVCLVVRRPHRERKIPGSNPVFAGIFLGSSHTSDLKIGTPVATLPGAWRYRVSTGTGRPGVSIL